MLKNIVPHNILGIAGIVLFTASFFIRYRTTDFHIYDTYYVTLISDLLRNMASILLTLFTVCTFLKQKLYSKILSWLHAGLTIISFLISIILLYKASNAYRTGFSDWPAFEINNKNIINTILIFLISQVLLVVNILIGLIKNKR